MEKRCLPVLFMSLVILLAISVMMITLNRMTDAIQNRTILSSGTQAGQVQETSENGAINSITEDSAEAPTSLNAKAVAINHHNRNPEENKKNKVHGKRHEACRISFTLGYL